MGRMKSPTLVRSRSPPHLPKKKDGLGLYYAKQVADGRCIGTAHSKIDQGHALALSTGHAAVGVYNMTTRHSDKSVQVFVKIGKQDVVRHFINGHPGVARQPIGGDFGFGLHSDFIQKLWIST